MATNLNERIKLIAKRSAYHAQEPKKQAPGAASAAMAAAGLSPNAAQAKPAQELRR